MCGSAIKDPLHQQLLIVELFWWCCCRQLNVNQFELQPIARCSPFGKMFVCHFVYNTFVFFFCCCFVLTVKISVKRVYELIRQDHIYKCLLLQVLWRADCKKQGEPSAKDSWNLSSYLRLLKVALLQATLSETSVEIPNPLKARIFGMEMISQQIPSNFRHQKVSASSAESPNF